MGGSVAWKVRFGLWFGTVAFVAVSGGACSSDPIQTQAIKDLGPEAPGIPVGPYHRAGQPCGVCHVKNGAAKSDFAISGTVLAHGSRLVGVDGATVDLVDSLGATASTRTNCVGNFFLRRNEYDPAFPVRVSVRLDNLKRDMKSVINREGSCSGCHRLQEGLDSPGPVVLYLTGENVPVPSCPVSPELLGERRP